MPKCQFSAAGDGGAAAAGERPYFILRKHCEKMPEGGEPVWKIERIRVKKKEKEREAERIVGMGRENK